MHKIAKPAYLSRILCSDLHAIARDCAVGDVAVM